MLVKATAIDRLMRDNPLLRERRYGLPDIGARQDGEKFNPIVQDIADATDFYGFEVRDDLIATIPDINLSSGNPMKYRPFPLAIKEMINSLENVPMYNYPYTEGDDSIRKILLDYIEREGIVNTNPYDYSDIDESGLSVHNLTFLPSTSMAFNMIVNIISKPGDVILVTGPNYGLFTIRAERGGAEVDLFQLEKEDNWKINPQKLAKRIDEINENLQNVYHRRREYVPRVVAFLNMNPHNPLGTVMGKNETKLLTEISKVCLDRGVFVIDDLVYRDISYNKSNIAKPIASIPGMFRNTISLFGLSKSYGMAGLRAGFVVADEVIIRELINRIFQEIDSSPDITGRALAGAFNTSQERDIVYQEYFQNLRKTYMFKYELLKVLVDGISAVKDTSIKNQITKLIEDNIKDKNKVADILNGLPYVKFPDNWVAEAGFFAILDFTALKGKIYKNNIIETERDLLTFFYKTSRLRFLIGQSISWPYTNELVGRITFSLEEVQLINAFSLMHDSIKELSDVEPLTIRKNILADQEQMARIKVDGWRAAYDGVIDQSYLDSLNYEKQTKRYIDSFAEYKDYVLVAVNNQKEVLAYSCFDLDPHYKDYDSEIVSFYVRPDKLGEGIGQKVFYATIKHLKEQGRKKLFLWCLIDNDSGIRFYKKLGGQLSDLKLAKIGDKEYKEILFSFNLDKY